MELLGLHFVEALFFVAQFSMELQVDDEGFQVLEVGEHVVPAKPGHYITAYDLLPVVSLVLLVGGVEFDFFQDFALALVDLVLEQYEFVDLLLELELDEVALLSHCLVLVNFGGELVNVEILIIQLLLVLHFELQLQRVVNLLPNFRQLAHLFLQFLVFVHQFLHLNRELRLEIYDRLV